MGCDTSVGDILRADVIHKEMQMDIVGTLVETLYTASGQETPTA